ncbi:hypothetical protein CRG98_002882, partial [Punica granatum]
MALVRERRQINLRLPLPELSERHPRFPLPLPPSAAGTASSSISVSDLEKLHVLGH